MVGFKFADATLNGSALVNVRIEKGELVAEQGGNTLHGTALAGAHLFAQVRNINAIPQTSATVEYKLDAIATELPAWDPLATGNTYIYTLKQWVPDTSSWGFACPADADGNKVAIPLTATWDESGARVTSSTLFTFGCTTGVIAKCYRWGYRPWVTGYGDLVTAHQTCTRMARADYCGTGRSYTSDGTEINAWDNLPSPGPIMHHTTAPTGMTFEAGWDTGGAVCFSHSRWLLNGTLVGVLCPTRLVAPVLVLGVLLGGTVCDVEADVLNYGSGIRLYDDSNLNLDLDLF
ncbi:MAG TPA: ADYC domain-containing protein [Kofleriaceae bacterium]